MRTLEMWFVIFNLIMLGWLIFARNKPQRHLIFGFGISAVLLLAHILIEGMRWQMIPAYAMTFIPIMVLALRYIPKSKKVKKKAFPFKTTLIAALAVLYSTIAVTLPLLLPVFKFEKPTGPYKIGTVTYDWKDELREEANTPSPDDKRELMVQIWYPANSSAKGKQAPYVAHPDIFEDGYSQALHMPKQLFKSLGLIKTHAIKGAELSNKETTYPVLLFSHGFNGVKNQNTFQIEELASHGYIVIGIDHTYYSTTSVFPDGRVVNFSPLEDSGYEYLDQLNKVWVEDTMFVIDQVEKLAVNDPDHRFTGRIDTDNMGMFGHSYGGATAVQTLLKDPRLKAAINMDGGLFGEQRLPEDGVKRPFLMMSADDTLAGTANMSDENIASQGTTREELDKFFDEVLSRYNSVAAGENYWMKIKNMKHMGFSDTYLLSPVLAWMEGVDVRNAHRLINEFSLDFFNHYLKQQPFKLMEQNIGEHSSFSLQKGAD
ncbi:carboxylic ester hydrolase [Paenibacillus lautus]|uniref:alpha/beta hydrolase family protein n=1 Tax=Paenibacillus lautus TaxID=1401 RepID=UPI001B03683C|nr:alpha/beta fold hydrolase [Paenibacillus lautus]GIO96925.1 carboxylic ester hydrolase [Paenibacillus lautus]